MSKLRKLTALFCALGMLVPSIAMATFGGTFGSPYTWSAQFASSSGAWKSPDATEVLEAMSYRHAGGLTGSYSTINPSLASDGWSSHGTVPVMANDLVVGLWCSTGHTMAGADGSTELVLGAWLLPSGTANASDIGSQVGSDWTYCTGGTCDSTRVGDNVLTKDTSSIVGTRISGDGNVIFGIREFTAGGASGSPHSQINCTMVFQRG